MSLERNLNNCDDKLGLKHVVGVIFAKVLSNVERGERGHPGPGGLASNPIATIPWPSDFGNIT